MTTPSISPKQKTIIIEVFILIAVFAGGYYLYDRFILGETTTISVTGGDKLLSANFISFINVTSREKISFKDVSFMSSPLVEMLDDYSEVISPNATRGRLDPFLPYASSRPLR